MSLSENLLFHSTQYYVALSRTAIFRNEHIKQFNTFTSDQDVLLAYYD